MNERIEDLLKQAFAECKTVEDGTMIRTTEAFARFAELIVRECARVAAQTPCPYTDDFARQTYGHTWDMACVESAKDIRKHFGVQK